MDLNIASIAKLLEDLSTQFDNIEQELRNNRECLDRIEHETIENVSGDLELKITHIGIMFNLITIE